MLEASPADAIFRSAPYKTRDLGPAGRPVGRCAVLNALNVLNVLDAKVTKL